MPLDWGNAASYSQDRTGEQARWTVNLKFSTAPEHFWRDQKLFLALDVSLPFCVILVPKSKVQERFRRAKNATVKRGELSTSVPARPVRATEIPKGHSYRVCWETDLEFNLEVSPTCPINGQKSARKGFKLGSGIYTLLPQAQDQRDISWGRSQTWSLWGMGIPLISSIVNCKWKKQIRRSRAKMCLLQTLTSLKVQIEATGQKASNDNQSKGLYFWLVSALWSLSSEFSVNSTVHQSSYPSAIVTFRNRTFNFNGFTLKVTHLPELQILS